MRPIKLKMMAFGPYKETEIVDFRELEDNQLFVISGATGSGKTTIFDGICFALYGQASGEDRTDVRAMRSDFSDNDTQTTVELIFEINHRTYRIMRQIPYTKVGNKTETSARCEFYERTEDGEVPVVDRQIVSEINKKAEELIGFTQAQFSQIVMLPQGEFRKFLTSDTENKETIMRKIFKTEPYREIVEQLKRKKDEAQAILATEKQLSDGYIKQIPSLLPQRDSPIFTVLANEYHNINQIVEALEEEFLFYAEKVMFDKKRYDDAYKHHEDMQTQYHAGKMLNERFDELENQQAMLIKLSERIPFMENEEKRLADAERAITIEPVERQFKELEKEVMEKRQHVEQAIKNVQLTTGKLEEVEVAYKQEESKGQEREKLTEDLIRLNDSLPVVAELQSKKEMLIAMKQKQDQLQIGLQETTELSQVEAEKVTKIIEGIEELEEKLKSLDEQTDLLHQTTEKSRIVDELVAIQKQVTMLEREKQRRELAYESNQQAYERFAEDWLMNEAAILAETLCEGDHCPVCGSTAHPEKARHSGELVISKEELDVKKKHLAKVESDYRIATANYESAVQQLGIKENDVIPFGVKPSETAVISGELHSLKKALSVKVDELRQDRETVVKLKEELHTQSAFSEQVAQKKVELERAVFEQNASLEKERAIFEHMVNAIPEDLRILKVLEQRIAELQAKKTALERAWTQVQELREKSREYVASAKSTEIHARSSLVEAEQKRDHAEKKFLEALNKSAFPTEAAYSAAKMAEAARLLLKDQLVNFKQQLHTLRETVKQLQETLSGKEKVALDELASHLTDLKEASETALTEYNASVLHEQSTVQLKENIIKTATKVSELEQELGRISNLYDVVRGQNGLKLSFERYIQIEYLERIIQSANERLREMTNGQFELIRSDRQEVRGRQSGLGLDVYDAYTGQNRDVKTLSGGEKFNASLCLALGMADVIQSFQGAVSIDTMFIDEGFGSLDEESLNKAIDTLIDLQKSGRMIGVISHVEELKVAFPATLEVKKSREGHSHTQFSVK